MVAPQAAEQHTRAAVIALLKREVKQRFGALGDGELVDRVQDGLQGRIGALRADLEDPMTDALGALFAHLCHYECGTAAQVADSLRSGMHARVGRLQASTERVRGWAASRYADVVSAFVGELRIFTGANAVLLCLVLIGLTRAPSHKRIQTIATLLLAATLIAVFFYVVNQNWLLTFVLADYVGWAYVTWVTVVFVLLVDAVFWRGRVTHAVVDTVSGMLHT